MQRWEMGPETGELTVHTEKEGVLSRMGHDLTIRVEDWSATACTVDGPGDGRTVRVEVRVDARSLRVVAPSELSAKDREEIRGHLDESVLAVDDHPTIRCEIDGLVPPVGKAPGRLTWEGKLELHGRRERIEGFLDVAPEGEGLRIRGETGFEQSRFGIRPFRAPLGVLKVADRVRVRFDLAVDRPELP